MTRRCSLMPSDKLEEWLLCLNCRRVREHHTPGGKCLFGPGTWRPLSRTDFDADAAHGVMRGLHATLIADYHLVRLYNHLVGEVQRLCPHPRKHCVGTYDTPVRYVCNICHAYNITPEES